MQKITGENASHQDNGLEFEKKRNGFKVYGDEVRIMKTLL